MSFFKSLRIGSSNKKTNVLQERNLQKPLTNNTVEATPPTYSTAEQSPRLSLASTLIPQYDAKVDAAAASCILDQIAPTQPRITAHLNLHLSAEPNDDYVKPGELTAGEKRIASLPKELWCSIADHLPLSAAAALSLSSKTLRHILGGKPWSALNDPDNRKERLLFLHHLDHNLPSHLLCFLCATYHVRLNPGSEQLKPNMVSKPLYACPLRRIQAYPRARLAHGRELPFAFVQLALRAHKNSPAHGVTLPSLSRSWRCKDSEWSHKILFHIHENGHLFMRVQSVSHAPPRMTPNQQRLLLFSRSDYTPYFSVCAHWAGYNLIPLCKCALGHVPEPAQGVFQQLMQHPNVSLKKTNAHILPKQCEECKPLRRCPECPTEYLVQLKLVEDKRDPAHQFKQAIVVTRWSDLGDGRSPNDAEWAACAGTLYEFDSAGAVKGASITSLFEMAVSRGAPGERMVWLKRGGVVNGKRLMADVY